MSMMDTPYPHLQPPINHLAVTVQAPAAALSRPDGQILAAGMDGLFVSDVRVLTQVRLTFGGFEPHHLTHLHEGTGRTRFISVAGGFGDPINDPTIRIERVRQVRPDGMSEEVRVSSTARRPVRAALAIELCCDLTPLEAAKSGRTSAAVPATATTGLTWSADGVTVTASGTGAEVSADPPTLRWLIELGPGERVAVAWQVSTHEMHPVLSTPARPVEWSRPRVHADDPRLARLLDRSLDDLAGLRLCDVRTDGDSFLGAGAPWFLTLFGRDSLWAARMLLPLGTELAEGTLRTLAARQGTVVDPASGEAPGKIMHELRHADPRLAVHIADGVLPATYYGTVDATLLWISLLAEAWRWGMAESAVATLMPALDRALLWLDRYGDPDGDGFVEYIDAAGHGLANQGWKDSFDAIRFHDGSLATAPIALCEVQGYAHRAALDAAELLDAFHRPGSGDRWLAYADALATRFRSRFWVDGALGPFPALAIDATGRPVDSLTSNIGHLLGSGMLSAAEEAIVARQLDSPSMSDGYGLRTMSTLDKGYSPLSYHCGSVWPHDTAIGLLGLSLAGAHREAANLIAGLLAAAETFDYRLPELYGGDARAEANRPVPYPGACRPQAWAAAASVSVLQATLGLTAHVPKGEFRVRPGTERGIGAIELDGARLAGARISVAVDRDGVVRVDGLPSHVRLVTRAGGSSPVAPRAASDTPATPTR